MHFQTHSLLIAFVALSLACDDCYGPRNDAAHIRHVRRMQPGAEAAMTSPKAPLAWGQINFLHTTDTHGWLEGHIKEQNYGADWGDYVSFTKSMKQKATHLGVDLLLIDTGDLHDGNGLSDASSPNGKLTNPIFESIDYDLLTIGNHELYVTEIAYETSTQFAKVYGDRYLTSNVKILNTKTGQFEYIGGQYRYFTSEHGLRIMAFGVLFDFTGNSNVSQVIKTADLVKEKWFLDAINYPQEIDMFVIIGHNPPRPTVSTSTFGLLHSTIRGLRPNVPIQVFGGHTHIRDFAVYDEMATGMESGRYCETLGFLSISGIQSTNFKGNMKPKGVPNPSRRAIRVADSSNSTNSRDSVSSTTLSTATDTRSASSPSGTSGNSSALLYARRYLDWNRRTFAYHAAGSQDKTFNSPIGQDVTNEITADRKNLNLTALYGCAPETYCQSCKRFGQDGNIFGLLTTALSAVVVNQSRASNPRIIIINTGSIRFDLVKGPFTYDDSFIVSPFTDGFQFIPSVPYKIASQILPILNAGPFEKRDRYDANLEFNFPQSTDACIDGMTTSQHDALGLKRRDHSHQAMTRGLHRRSETLTPGYVTYDDFGSDGDDTPHSAIPSYPQPNNIQANASFPTNGSLPETVDLVFLDFIGSEYIIPALQKIDPGKYKAANISYYLPKTFTTNSYLPAYAKKAWQANMPNCPVGEGVGFTE